MLPLDKTSEDIPKDEVAVEIKCALVTAQVPTEGPPMKLTGALPQQSNAGSSDFNNACVDACITSNGVLVSFAVDGAATDANYVRDMIVAFLAKETNCVAIVDPNHVAKAVRNQNVLGTSVVQAGEGLVDPGLLLAVDVPCDLFAATHVQRLLQVLLGLPEPVYRHHRLLVGPDGKRYAKRDRAETLQSLREQGVSPDRLIAELDLEGDH